MLQGDKNALEKFREVTNVGHITEGVEFLGQHLSKLWTSEQFLITPARKNTEAFPTKVRNIVRSCQSAPQEKLIATLNPVMPRMGLVSQARCPHPGLHIGRSSPVSLGLALGKATSSRQKVRLD